MSNDLLKQLEEKINEAIETIEFSRMEMNDLKEKNDELENRYVDWEQRLSTLIEKFEQLEEVEEVEEVEEAEPVEVKAKVDTSIQEDEEANEMEAESVVAEEDVDEEIKAEVNTEEFEEDEIEESTFGTSADSYTEAPGSSQHYA